LKFKKFSKFALIWYSQQFAIPFWIVGHVHLSLSDYHETVEVAASAFLHLIVALGFWLDWKNYDADREDED
jgi:hypothetical protein